MREPMQERKPKLSVVMPVYNERNTLEEIVRRVMAVEIDKELIIVDDCSTDGSREILKKVEHPPGIRVFYQEKNMGKGAALARGFQHVNGEIIIIQDADLEYHPREYPMLIEPILDGRADVVYGSRFLGGSHRVLFFWHYVGNKFLTLLSNMLTNLNLTDMETCYKAFRADLLKKIRIVSKRFGVEPEITAKVARANARVFEIPISYSGRDYSEGKKIGWKDGLAAVYTILRFNLFGS